MIDYPPIPRAARERFNQLEAEERAIQEGGLSQVGTSIPILFGSTNNFIINPSNIGTGTLHRMVMTDDTISSAVQFKGMMALAKIGEYHHDKPEISDYVNDYLNKMSAPSWRASMEAQMSSRAYGFSASEIIWALADDLVKYPYRIATYHPSTLAFEVDPNGMITPTGILQFVLQYSQFQNPNNIWAKINYGSNTRNPFTTPTDRLFPYRQPFLYNYGLVRIPRDKVIHHTNLPMFSFGSPYGVTEVRTAHLLWQLKVFILRQLGIATKRNATNTLWVTAPHNQNKVKVVRPDGSIVELNPADAMREILRLRESDDALITGPETAGYGVKAVQDEADLDKFTNTINNINVWEFRCFLLPSLVMTDGSAGSRSLGDKHFQLVDQMAGSDADKFTEVLTNDMIKKSIIDNFGVQKDYGRFNRRPQSIEERERLANMFATLAGFQAWKPHVEQDMDFMRKELSLPPDMDKSFSVGTGANPTDPNADPNAQPGEGGEPQPPEDGEPSNTRNRTAPQPKGAPADPKAPVPAPAAGGADKVADEALNGAQISSLVDIIKSVAAGELPRESAIEIIVHAFNMDREQAEKIMGKAGNGFKPASQEDVDPAKPAKETKE